MLHSVNMKIADLSHIDADRLHAVFIEAFSDYQIPVTMTQAEFEETNEQRSVELSDSFGAFNEKGDLVGFILCGVRSINGEVSFYDGATAVIASCRGNGIAALLLEAAVERARERGAKTFVLEVLIGNERAEHLYRSRGFVTERLLRCFHKERESVQAGGGTSEDIIQLERESLSECRASLALPFRPSWQNAPVSIDTVFDSLIVRGLKRRGKWVGWYAMAPRSADIMNICAADESPETFRTLLADAAIHTEAEKLKFIDIEKESTLFRFLMEDQWEVMIDQVEMVRLL